MESGSRRPNLPRWLVECAASLGYERCALEVPPANALGIRSNNNEHGYNEEGNYIDEFAIRHAVLRGGQTGLRETLGTTLPPICLGSIDPTDGSTTPGDCRCPRKGIGTLELSGWR